MMYTDQFIRDYNHVDFQNAFRAYFTELGIQVTDWNGLFQQMTDEGVPAIVRKNEKGMVIGFIQFSRIEMTSWFFEERYGFIQEFWIAPEFRGRGHGTSLLKQAEGWFEKQGVRKMILTTDTAEAFYVRRGYRRANGVAAKNRSPVYVKE